MKTTFLQTKRNPGMLVDKSYQERTADFLNQHSNIMQNKFWNSIDNASKLKATKYWTFQEVTEPKNIRIMPKRDRAEVYIVLSGSAVVTTTGSGEEIHYGPGDVFGSIDMFDDAATNDNFENEISRAVGAVMSAQFTKGSFMRMSLHDFYNHVINPEDIIEEVDETEHDAAIAEIPYEELTEDDKFYVRVFKRAKQLVNHELFCFMDSYRMVPKNARMVAFRYYNEGSIGREVYLDENDIVWVFVIIEGSIRLEITSTRSSKQKGARTIAFKRGGKKDMAVKTQAMPLMLLQAGAVLCLQDECFTVGRRPEVANSGNEAGLLSPSAPSEAEYAPASPDNAIRRDSLQTVSTVQSISSVDSKLHKRGVPFSVRPKGKPPSRSAGAPYHLKMVFEAQTTYLAIPYDNFEKLLDPSNKLVLPKIQAEIKSQLRYSNDSILERIRAMEPWIHGNLQFTQKEPKVKKTVLPAIQELGFVVSDKPYRVDFSATNPVGSFPTRPLRDSSLLSQSMSTDSLKPVRRLSKSESKRLSREPSMKEAASSKVFVTEELSKSVAVSESAALLDAPQNSTGSASDVLEAKSESNVAAVQSAISFSGLGSNPSSVINSQSLNKATSMRKQILLGREMEMLSIEDVAAIPSWVNDEVNISLQSSLAEN